MEEILTKSLSFSLDSIPPSSNHIYSTGKHGQRFLTQAGQTYKDRVVATVSELVLLAGDWRKAAESIYTWGGEASMTLILSLPNLYNGTWKPGVLAPLPKGGYRSPYKKLDVSNYLKIAEDGIVLATGIDDSFTTHHSLTKIKGPAQVTIIYEIFLNHPIQLELL